MVANCNEVLGNDNKIIIANLGESSNHEIVKIICKF